MSPPNPLREGMPESPGRVPGTVVIFGATGDLTRRKLLPALYNLAYDGLLHEDTSIVGCARRDWNDEVFQKKAREGIDEHSRRDLEDEVWDRLCGDLAYVQGDFDDEEAYGNLVRKLDEIESARSRPGCRLFYLATPPDAFPVIVNRLKEAGLAPGEDKGQGPPRLVVEKPFGHDLDSATELNRTLQEVFHEDQVFRIDHYLGKETVQNLLVFRLDNGIFEPLWNGRHVDHVQITVAESVGVGDRGGYYEGVGAVRDMLQNHMLQLLTLVAMEPPVRYDAKSVRDEKVKVLRSIRLPGDDVSANVVRAQYAAGAVAGREQPGYREEKKVAEDSVTETYLAARFEVRNWRWAGTRFYLRTGKCLPRRATEIAIVFKAPPLELFQGLRSPKPESNVLRVRVQPEEGISLSFGSKIPGQELRIGRVRMDFSYARSFGEDPPEAYERLLLEAMEGDSTLFARHDEVELAWGLVDRIVDAWRDSGGRPREYEAGTWGPEEADRLIADDGRQWIQP